MTESDDKRHGFDPLDSTENPECEVCGQPQEAEIHKRQCVFATLDFQRCLKSQGHEGEHDFSIEPTPEPEAAPERVWVRHVPFFGLSVSVDAREGSAEYVRPSIALTDAVAPRFPDFDSLLEVLGEIGDELDAEGLNLETADRIYENGRQDGITKAKTDAIKEIQECDKCDLCEDHHRPPNELNCSEVLTTKK